MHIISMNLNNCEDFWNYRFFLIYIIKTMYLFKILSISIFTVPLHDYEYTM